MKVITFLFLSIIFTMIKKEFVNLREDSGKFKWMKIRMLVSKRQLGSMKFTQIALIRHLMTNYAFVFNYNTMLI